MAGKLVTAGVLPQVLQGAVGLLYLAVLGAAAWKDWRTKRIHNGFVAAIALLGVVSLWLFPSPLLWDRVWGACIVSLPMFLLAFAVRGAFGGGDIKLLAAGGFFLGWRAVLFAACTAFLAGGLYCAVMLSCKKMGRKDRFAFGPFLAFGLAVAFLETGF